MPDAPLTVVPPPEKPPLKAVAGDYVPAVFLLWGVFGMVRPIFDQSAYFDPIFWYVGGASLLTIYGRLATRHIEGDDDDDETFDEKYRFTLPVFLRKGRK